MFNFHNLAASILGLSFQRLCLIHKTFPGTGSSNLEQASSGKTNQPYETV